MEKIRELARRLSGGHEKAMLQCATLAWRMNNGGNQWSGWAAYISFFRYVAMLNIDYSKWDHYEQAAIHAGPRWMHPKFCIVSDRPGILKTDEQNRPHCEEGPFCQWRDGSRLYAIHGVRVPSLVVEHPELLTADMMEGHTAEVQSVMYNQSPLPEKAIHLLRKSVR